MIANNKTKIKPITQVHSAKINSNLRKNKYQTMLQSAEIRHKTRKKYQFLNKNDFFQLRGNKY